MSVAEIKERIRKIIEPWIGVRADLIPREVQKLVVLYNEL